MWKQQTTSFLNWRKFDFFPLSSIRTFHESSTTPKEISTMMITKRIYSRDSWWVQTPKFVGVETNKRKNITENIRSKQLSHKNTHKMLTYQRRRRRRRWILVIIKRVNINCVLNNMLNFFPEFSYFEYT